jgi:subtilisin family serine protease
MISEVRFGRGLAAVAAAVALVSCGGGGGSDPAASDLQSARIKQADDDAAAAEAAAVGTRYIVKLKDEVSAPGARGREIAAAHGAQLHHQFERALKGFAVTVPPGAVAAFLRAMERDPDVDLVEPDAVMTGTQTVQTGATWGLDRTDQRLLPLSGTYSYGASGAGVQAFIIDSGLRSTHSEFQGRVLPGYTAINDGYGTNDCNGHGTHVAGTVAGQTWGMAKGANVVPVRVLGCDGSGYVSGIVAGIDWMIANAKKPAVANMSLGGSATSTLDSAVAKAVSNGITMAVAAGNSNADACNTSPARAPSAITVGATGSSDERASYSNWGTCLDVFAPGNSITSASNGSDNGAAIMSGTSMASPHVTGLAAVYLQSNPGASPATVASAIKAGATTGLVAGAGAGSPNALIYTDVATTVITPEPTPTPTPAPGTAVSIASLSGSASRHGRNWRASVGVAVKNSAGAPVAGAVVTGDFSVGGSGLGCTTSTAGTCSIASGAISGSTTQTQFSVRGIGGAGYTYDGASNSVSSVVIAKP